VALESKTIEEAIGTFDRNAVASKVAEAEQLRKAFVEQFPIEEWSDLPVERYALGVETEGGTISWWLEFKTNIIGSMRGGNASKHLIWLHSDGAWRYPRAYASLEVAWSAVRSGFVEMFRLASEGRFDDISQIKALSSATALRSKTLYMYFPDQLLPVSSKAHLDHFLRSLGDPAESWSSAAANRRLMELLRTHPSLREMSNQELGYFLYHWADPRTTVKVSKIAPGHQADHWEECIEGKFICVGWDDVGDLSQFSDREAFNEAFLEVYPYNGNRSHASRKANELWTLMDLQPGDKIIANRGTSEVLAIGTVTDEGYVFRPERPDYRHTLGVDWDTSYARKIKPVKAWATNTVARVSADLYKRILGTAVLPDPVEVDKVYLEIEGALARRGQVILYGPPGTGKTFTARHAAVWLLNGGSANPDASGVLSDGDHFLSRERRFGTGDAQSKQVWFMVANPTQWAWNQLFKDGSVSFALGRLKRNYPHVRAGDLVVGYESTPSLRVVALARTTSEYDPDEPNSAALTLEPVIQVDGPSWAELQADPILSKSEPVRFRCQGTLFGLTPVEADRLLAVLAESSVDVAAKIETGSRQLTRITFHPSYSYEDFVEGFRPRPTNSGMLELGLTDGVFKEVCSAAAADPDNRYVVLIDEINRGNIPKIFGELITLIEKDKRGLTVLLPQSGEQFLVPPNLVIIGTMNTADRSIHLLDTALRRRFAFIELLPDPQSMTGATVGQLALDTFLDALNERVRDRVGREKQIGHALFYDDGHIVDTAEAFAAVFRHELLPLLQEYLFEDYKQLAEVLGSSIIDTDTQRTSTLVDDPEGLCSALADEFQASASS
jgi:5-methylcytosine-specific restriction protein B